MSLRIIHLNTYDCTGGAARSAYRLHAGLCQLGADSAMYVMYKSSGDPGVSQFQPFYNRWRNLRRRIRSRLIARQFAPYATTRPAGLEIFSNDLTVNGDEVIKKLPAADIYNLHWIAGFVDVGAFFQAVRRPVVWTLHDMNAFTGGCHYNVGCRRFETCCGACPQLGSPVADDLSNAVWRRKQTALEHRKAALHIVTPSRWLAAEAQRSSLLGARPVSVIPYGLDTQVFHPYPADGLRTVFDIPAAQPVLLFVSDHATNARKGFTVLQEVFRALPAALKITLVSVGSGSPRLEAGQRHIHLGRIDNDLILAAVYSMADLFVIPSQEDNLPNTVLEALACGTPVVGFDVGGIPDMVRPGETGLLARVGDTEGLRDAIVTLLQDRDKLSGLSARCREIAVREYDLTVQAQRYRALYESLLAGGVRLSV